MLKRGQFLLKKVRLGNTLKIGYEYGVFIQISIFLFNFQGVLKCHEFFNNLSYPGSQNLQKNIILLLISFRA